MRIQLIFWEKLFLRSYIRKSKIMNRIEDLVPGEWLLDGKGVIPERVNRSLHSSAKVCAGQSACNYNAFRLAPRGCVVPKF